MQFEDVKISAEWRDSINKKNQWMFQLTSEAWKFWKSLLLWKYFLDDEALHSTFQIDGNSLIWTQYIFHKKSETGDIDLLNLPR